MARPRNIGETSLERPQLKMQLNHAATLSLCLHANRMCTFLMHIGTSSQVTV